MFNAKDYSICLLVVVVNDTADWNLHYNTIISPTHVAFSFDEWHKYYHYYYYYYFQTVCSHAAATLYPLCRMASF